MNRNQYAKTLLEKHPYAIASSDEGYQIHFIDPNGYNEIVLITFENEVFVRTLYYTPVTSYFIHNNNRVYLSSFYEV